MIGTSRTDYVFNLSLPLFKEKGVDIKGNSSPQSPSSFKNENNESSPLTLSDEYLPSGMLILMLGLGKMVQKNSTTRLSHSLWTNLFIGRVMRGVFSSNY